MNLKQIDAALSAYHDSLVGSETQRLAFFRQLWEIEADASTSALPYELPATKQLCAWYAAGESVFKKQPVLVDAALLARTLERLSACAVEKGGFSEEACAALVRVKWERVVAASPLEQAGRDPQEYLEQFVDVLVDDGMSEVQAHLAALLASLALRAQFRCASEAIVKAQLACEAAASAPLRCPVCGDDATVSCVGGRDSAGQGRGKTLWCAQCGATWDFERIRCVRCGTQNQAHLHYFNVEGDDAHRIATCDECGGYARTVYSEDTLAPFSFEVEDVVMTRLDAIAQKQVLSERVASR